MKYWVFIFYFLVSAYIQAQNPILTVDKSEILLGEPLTLKFEITDNAHKSSMFFIDSIPHFVVIQDTAWQEQKNNATVRFRQLTLTSFDEGNWLIPPIKIGSTSTNAIYVKVRLSKGFSTSQPYHDIKDIENIPIKPSGLKWIYFLIVCLFFITVVYFIVRWRTLLKQKENKKEIAPLIADYYQYTLDEIEKINYLKTKPPFYIEKLIDLFRNYIFHETGIQSLQQTTHDLAEQLKKYFIEDDKYKKLKQNLSITDLVKFAKLEITSSSVEQLQQEIINGIKTIHQFKKKKNTEG